MRDEFAQVESHGSDARVIGLKESIVGAARPMLIVLLATVGVVLVIATVNVEPAAGARHRTALRAGTARVARWRVASGGPGRIRYALRGRW